MQVVLVFLIITSHLIGRNNGRETRNANEKKASSVSKHVTTLRNDNFEAILQDSIWVVKFYASWCSHCKQFSPIYDKIADEITPTLQHTRLAEVNCETEFVICKHYDIDAYPSLFLMVDGKLRGEFTGRRTPTKIKAWIETESKEAVLDFMIDESDDTLKPKLRTNPHFKQETAHNKNKKVDSAKTQENSKNKENTQFREHRENTKKIAKAGNRGLNKGKKGLPTCDTETNFKFPVSLSHLYQILLGDTPVIVPILIYMMGAWTSAFVGVVFFFNYWV